MVQVAVTFLAALLAAPVASRDAVTECDKLASNPEDPDRVAPGVPRNEVKLAAAIAACEAEVAREPSRTRPRYQLARVLFYAGETERAAREMRAAADAGNRQAQFVYGALISNRRDNAPTDMCLVEQYWLKSARAGRQAARVSYVRHALKGRFDGCRIEATRDEMAQLLSRAKADARDYYERLLIEDLTEQLAIFRGELRNRSIAHARGNHEYVHHSSARHHARLLHRRRAGGRSRHRAAAR